MRYELRTDEDFIKRLDRVSKGAGLTKPQAIEAGIELLEKLINADKEGKEFAIVNKTKKMTGNEPRN